MFGNITSDPTQILKFMMMKQMFGQMFGKTSSGYDDRDSKNPMMALMPMLFLTNGGFNNMFNAAFGAQPSQPTVNPFDNLFNMFGTNPTTQNAAPNSTPIANTKVNVSQTVTTEAVPANENKEV